MSKFGLNVGSGQRPFHSTPEVQWVNVDTAMREGEIVDLPCDGRHLPYEDATIDYFVLHHVLEHFSHVDGLDLVKEAHRVLKPGGSLLVFVPDMQALAQRWLMGKIDNYLYFTNVYGTGRDEFDRHRQGFTRESLYKYLSEGGKWQSMEPFTHRSIAGADIAGWAWWILEAECVR